VARIFREPFGGGADFIGMRDESSQDQPRLREALKGVYAPKQEVPPEVEEGILRRGRAVVGSRGSRWRIGLFGAVAAAAVVLMAVGSWSWLFMDPQPLAVYADARDVNGDGRVDVLDAMSLARRLEQGGAPAAGHDVNEDGRVDQADVDAIAMAAVRLEGS
jgi:hypothetical protein